MVCGLGGCPSSLFLQSAMEQQVPLLVWVGWPVAGEPQLSSMCSLIPWEASSGAGHMVAGFQEEVEAGKAT